MGRLLPYLVSLICVEAWKKFMPCSCFMLGKGSMYSCLPWYINMARTPDRKEIKKIYPKVLCINKQFLFSLLGLCDLWT